MATYFRGLQCFSPFFKDCVHDIESVLVLASFLFSQGREQQDRTKSGLNKVEGQFILIRQMKPSKGYRVAV